MSTTTFDWTTGHEDYPPIARPTVPSLRYNIIRDIPSTFTTWVENATSIKCTTNNKFQPGSLYVTIDKQVVKSDEIIIPSSQTLVNQEFDIVTTNYKKGVILVEYLPYKISNYISDTPITTTGDSICINRTIEITPTVIYSIKDAIVKIEYYMSHDRDTEQYLYSNKIIFDSDIKNDIKGITKEEISNYQTEIINIIYILNTLNNDNYTADLTDIALDVSDILKDKYILELRKILVSLDRTYNIVASTN